MGSTLGVTGICTQIALPLLQSRLCLLHHGALAPCCVHLKHQGRQSIISADWGMSAFLSGLVCACFEGIVLVVACQPDNV